MEKLFKPHTKNGMPLHKWLYDPVMARCLLCGMSVKEMWTLTLPLIIYDKDMRRKGYGN